MCSDLFIRMNISKIFFLSALFFLQSCDLFAPKKEGDDEAGENERPVENPAASNDDSDLNDSPEMPAQFSGGNQNMMRYLQQNIKYPSFCSENSIQGKVYIEFVIDAEGYVTHAKVKRGVHPHLDNEALRVVKNMPQWSPATDMNGNNVRCRYVLPVNFKLE
jgi:TonB family protein